MGCFPVDFQEVERPLGAKSGKSPIKVGKRPIKEGKRPIKAMVLVGMSCSRLLLMGCFPAPPPWRKTAPLKRLITGWLKNRTGTGVGTGTVGTVFQEPKPEPEPCLSAKPVVKQKKPLFQRRTVGTENRNRLNRPIHEP